MMAEHTLVILPPPHDIRRDLQLNMGLQDDHDTFIALTGLLKSLIRRMLDTNVSYSDQNKEKWQELVNKACDAYPFLHRYPDAWPVKAFAQRYLGSKNKSAGNNSCPRQNGLQTRSQSMLENRARTSRTNMPGSQADINAPVFRDFLHGLELKDDIDELLRRLLKAGITDQDCLLETLSWSESDQYLLFRIDIGLSSFHHRSLVRKLRAKVAAKDV
ncbi:unnamed protein product [Somion occarium]|uniref:Uncharacterized protein n=1 Tax=Somion occarium TaxID=3059160 RepID=A0ABP1D2J5_9APHY